MRTLVAGAVVPWLLVCSVLAVRHAADAQPPPAAPAAREAPASVTPPVPSPAPVDSFANERDSLMNVVLGRIAGRENAPAESVFKNIKVLKGVPAGRLVRIMNMGFGKSLGVGCKHCHVPDRWDDEEKPQKQIAREMSGLVQTINTELLPKIKHLRSDKPTVNCTTCHRGARKPALNL